MIVLHLWQFGFKTAFDFNLNFILASFLFPELYFIYTVVFKLLASGLLLLLLLPQANLKIRLFREA